MKLPTRHSTAEHRWPLPRWLAWLLMLLVWLISAMVTLAFWVIVFGWPAAAIEWQGSVALTGVLAFMLGFPGVTPPYRLGLLLIPVVLAAVSAVLYAAL